MGVVSCHGTFNQSYRADSNDKKSMAKIIAYHSYFFAQNYLDK